MRTFLTAVELNSFAAAARELNIARSVVTKRVSQLEWALKTQLLVRTTRQLRLTEDGELYLDRIRKSIRSFVFMISSSLSSCMPRNSFHSVRMTSASA